MDGTVIAAIIAAIAAVVAALIGAWKKKRDAKSTQLSSSKFGNVIAGRDAVVAGRDAILVQQQSVKERFLSRNGAQLVSQVAKDVIQDERVRFRWSSFDVQFLDKCIKDTVRGWVFDDKASKEFQQAENDGLLALSVAVYTECCRRIGDGDNEDYKAFNRIADIYWNMRKVLNPEAAAAAEWWYSTKKESALCDDCSRSLKKGQGYIVPGTVFQLDDGSQIVNGSPSLVCESCFRLRKEAGKTP
jgi:hypothetical protein